MQPWRPDSDDAVVRYESPTPIAERRHGQAGVPARTARRARHHRVAWALHVILSAPDSSGSRPLADGQSQAPGGWNRIVSTSTTSTHGQPSPQRRCDVPQRHQCPDPGASRFRSPIPTAIRSLHEAPARFRRRRPRAGTRRTPGSGRRRAPVNQLLTDDRGLVGAAQPLQAFVVAVQAPHVARVLARPGQRGVQPEVGGVHLGGLLDAALLEQQRAVGVPGRLHPAPRLVVRE